MIASKILRPMASLRRVSVGVATGEWCFARFRAQACTLEFRRFGLEGAAVMAGAGGAVGDGLGG